MIEAGITIIIFQNAIYSILLLYRLHRLEGEIKKKND